MNNSVEDYLQEELSELSAENRYLRQQLRASRQRQIEVAYRQAGAFLFILAAILILVALIAIF